MRNSEFSVVIILPGIGNSGLFAIPFIFLTFPWMDGFHNYVGIGEMPKAPIVNYLARSLSAFYAILGAFTLFISFDINRYRNLVTLCAGAGRPSRAFASSARRPGPHTGHGPPAALRSRRPGR